MSGIKLSLPVMICAYIFCGSQKACIPGWVNLKSMQKELMIQGEAVSIELGGGSLSIYSGEKALYQSALEWIVADCFIADIDHDHSDEVLLHVWKLGSFGEHQPFWRENDDKSVYSEHLFIYEWDVERADRLDPKWMSSAMPVEGQEIFVEENGKIHILSADEETVWIWEGWGLVLLESSQKE